MSLNNTFIRRSHFLVGLRNFQVHVPKLTRQNLTVRFTCFNPRLELSNFFSDPLTEIGRLDVGSIVNASNVSRTNMVALIGGGERPKFSQNTLVVYDAAASEPVMDITFGSPLRKVVIVKTEAL